MPLSDEQLKTLLGLVSSVTEDDLDCDGCLNHVSEFAENELTGRDQPEALAAVRTHLENCPCCAKEFQTFLEALQDMDTDE